MVSTGELKLDVSCNASDHSVINKSPSIDMTVVLITYSLYSQVTGKCGSVSVRLIPAPRGTGIVSGPVPKKLLMMSGIEDCYTSARGSTATLGNFAKATYAAIAKTYAFLTPDLWRDLPLGKTPYQEFAEYLAKPQKVRFADNVYPQQ